MPTAQAMNGRQTLDAAFHELQTLLPPRVARWLAWLRTPKAVWVRIPAGLICLAAAALWFLPVIGIEWALPGLLLLAQDVPFLRRPVGRLILFLIDQGRRLRSWWQAQRS